MVYIVYLQKRIAANITLEQGKTLVNAEGDVIRGLRKCYPDITLNTYYLLYKPGIPKYSSVINFPFLAKCTGRKLNEQLISPHIDMLLWSKKPKNSYMWLILVFSLHSIYKVYI